MQFHEIRFPASLSMGALGGPERRTEIVTLASGHEERNTPWAQSRRRYDAGLGLRSLDDIATLVAFFEARRGQMVGFRWKDWADYRSGLPSRAISFDDQRIGTGDGVSRSFALVKSYASGPAREVRPITKPVEGTVLAGVGDQELAEGDHFEVDTATGLVTFVDPPAHGVAVTAGFEFDVPVRFDMDRLQVSVATFQAGEVPNVPVVEVRV